MPSATQLCHHCLFCGGGVRQTADMSGNSNALFVCAVGESGMLGQVCFPMFVFTYTPVHKPVRQCQVSRVCVCACESE